MPSPQEMSAALLGDQDPWVSSPLMGPGGQAMANTLQGVASNVASLPQRAFESSENLRQGGNYDPAPVVEAAQYLMGGGMPMAEAGAAGIFGGKLAQTADASRRGVAHIMELRGAHPTEIWQKTGWAKGPDGNWRFEIPDRMSALRLRSQAELKYPGLPDTVGGLLHHPNLYNSYPDLKNLPLRLGDNPNYSGLHMPAETGRESIEVSKEMPLQEIHETLLHELQHAVQDREGFASGTTMDAQRQLVLDELKKEGVVPNPNDPLMNNFIIARMRDRYKSHMGEVEARNVERRMNFTPNETRAIPPAETEDIQRLVQILKAPNRSPYSIK